MSKRADGGCSRARRATATGTGIGGGSRGQSGGSTDPQQRKRADGGGSRARRAKQVESATVTPESATVTDSGINGNTTRRRRQCAVGGASSSTVKRGSSHVAICDYTGRATWVTTHLAEQSKGPADDAVVVAL